MSYEAAYTMIRRYVQSQSRRHGFTIVELLIVIVVIGILAAITIVAFNGAQDRARNSQTQAALNQAHKLLQLYASEHGSYPSTGGLTTSLADTNCGAPTVTKTAEWIPNLATPGKLPQGNNLLTGIGTRGGCFLYASDGTSYVLSAWNMVSGGPQSSSLYRRLGFREMSNTPFYYCNHPNIGGASSGTYVATSDYYKHSYTISNITTCVETPPAGA